MSQNASFISPNLSCFVCKKYDLQSEHFLNTLSDKIQTNEKTVHYKQTKFYVTIFKLIKIIYLLILGIKGVIFVYFFVYASAQTNENHVSGVLNMFLLHLSHDRGLIWRKLSSN